MIYLFMINYNTTFSPTVLPNELTPPVFFLPHPKLLLYLFYLTPTPLVPVLPHPNPSPSGEGLYSCTCASYPLLFKEKGDEVEMHNTSNE